MPDSKPVWLPWTAEEDAELVRLHSDGKSYAQCAEAIGRTRRACETRWHALKRQKKPCRLINLWTPEEDAMLRELWPDQTVEQISERIGRTEKGVYRRANRLGLTSGEQPPKTPWTPEEDEVLRENIGSLTYAEIGILLGRTDKSVKQRALSLQLRGGPKPRPPKPRTGQRRCHDCGRPTSDYRCPKCWAKLREKYRYEE